MLKAADDDLKVAYIYSQAATNAFDLLPSNRGRSSMVHSLVKAVGLMEYVQIYGPKESSLKFLEFFHGRDYLGALMSSSSEALSPEELEEFGLVDDAAPFPGLQSYVKQMAGAVDCIQKALEDGLRYVINWDGGRHHAQSSSASGYCYINDAVVLILGMQEFYDRILYIDLDLHHGDGVENAFYYSDRVFTLSLHKFKPGFYPGSGDSQSIGRGKGIGYCRNIPIQHEICGQEYFELFENNFNQIVTSFDPDIIVCVCGADSLATDPHQGFNLGTAAYSKCIESILHSEIPTVFLGGGGYNHADTAKCWTKLTHSIVSASKSANLGIPFPSLVPEHEFWPEYVNNDEMEVKERCGLLKTQFYSE